MVATNQEQKEQPEGDEGASPESNKPEGKEPQEGLINEVTKLRAQRRERDELIEKNKAELARLQEQLKALQKPPADPVEDIKSVKAQLAEIQAARQRETVGRSLGLGDKQSDVVMKIMAQNNLNPVEALQLAKLREPETFAQSEGSGFDASMHGTLGTTRGAPPLLAQDDDFQDRKKRIRELQSVDQLAADRLRNNMIGGLAAEAMGLRHHKIPIK